MNSIIDRSTEPRDAEKDGSRYWLTDLDVMDPHAESEAWVGIVDENQGGIFAYAHETHAKSIIAALRAYTGEI